MLDSVRESVSLYQVIVLVVLTLITINRRRLSANHEYRSRSSAVARAREKSLLAGGSVRRRGPIFRLTRFIIRFVRRRLGTLEDPMVPLTLAHGETDSAASSEVGSVCGDPTTIENIGEGNFTVLTTELLIAVVSCLDTKDIVRLGLTSRSMWRAITSDIVWEQLWTMTYGSAWTHPAIQDQRARRGIFWDPQQNFGPPLSGWFHFFLAFESCWSDWLLAGSCTTHCTVLALNGALFDVTDFLSQHPGSPETLAIAAGCDATETFLDIGHSSHAESLMQQFCILDPHEDFVDAPKTARLTVSTRRIPRFGPLHALVRHFRKEVLSLVDQDAVLTGPRRAIPFGLTLPAQLDSAVEPLIAKQQYFGPAFRVAPDLAGFNPCDDDHNHQGQFKSYFDPLSCEWCVWCSFCGSGFRLRHPPSHLEDFEGAWIFR